MMRIQLAFLQWCYELGNIVLAMMRIPHSDLFLCFASILSLARFLEAADRRQDAIEGSLPCLEYNVTSKTFRLSCSFLWTNVFGVGSDKDFISLAANETFEGDAAFAIDLTGITQFEGMLSSMATSFADAPVIRHVHLENGSMSQQGGGSERPGYIIRASQKFVIVEFCSSTGRIGPLGSGGIAGSRCGGNGGHAVITNSWTTGDILGPNAGGIIGESGGSAGEILVEDCSSFGNIAGPQAGGIAGNAHASFTDSSVIRRCFSMGEISGFSAGGIVGAQSGNQALIHDVSQCYSLGNITGNKAGGIAGAVSRTLSISDSFSRGQISGSEAGGIIGANAGLGVSNVALTNVYAAGSITSADGGGLFGSIDTSSGQIEVFFSVYSSGGAGITGDGASLIDIANGNSDNLSSITGKLYHFGGTQRWVNTTWLPLENSLPILVEVTQCPIDCVRAVPGQPKPSSSSTPTATSSATPSVTMSSSPTVTSTRTSTFTPTPSMSSTTTVKPSSSSSPSTTASNTALPTPVDVDVDVLVNSKGAGQTALLPCAARGFKTSILSDSNTDATDIVPESIRMGTQFFLDTQRGCTISPPIRFVDVDKDDRLDLEFVCRGDIGISVKNETAMLIFAAETDTSRQVFGSLEVRVIGNMVRRKELEAARNQ
eukprot:gb/GECG01000324.1/.p1 GENE.gb/GECG01000324.1/~~gb/GECG01000324.1/.p1  ORF type:complete len:657 (+),score=72.28 gb/GECG01000324.1/:1-1971(+)